MLHILHFLAYHGDFEILNIYWFAFMVSNCSSRLFNVKVRKLGHYREPIMKAITKSVNIQLDSLLVRLKLCSIEGRTGPIMPVSREPMKTPIRIVRVSDFVFLCLKFSISCYFHLWLICRQIFWICVKWFKDTCFQFYIFSLKNFVWTSPTCRGRRFLGNPFYMNGKYSKLSPRSPRFCF